MTQPHTLSVKYEELIAGADEPEVSVPRLLAVTRRDAQAVSTSVDSDFSEVKQIAYFEQPDRGEQRIRTTVNNAASAQWRARVERLNPLAYKKFALTARLSGVRLKSNHLGPVWRKALPATISNK